DRRTLVGEYAPGRHDSKVETTLRPPWPGQAGCEVMLLVADVGSFKGTDCRSGSLPVHHQVDIGVEARELSSLRERHPGFALTNGTLGNLPTVADEVFVRGCLEPHNGFAPRWVQGRRIPEDVR